MRRHFAFFSQTDGAYIREAAGDVPEPRIPAWVNGSIRLALLDRWATKVSQPRPGEIGLDVTQFDYPLGDFAWSSFDLVDRRLDWVEPHYWIEGDIAERRLVANTASPRPIRSHDTRLVLDVTGTPLQQHHGHLFGAVKRDGDCLVFEQDGREPLRIRLPEPRQLAAVEESMVRALGD